MLQCEYKITYRCNPTILIQTCCDVNTKIKYICNPTILIQTCCNVNTELLLEIILKYSCKHAAM